MVRFNRHSSASTGASSRDHALIQHQSGLQVIAGSLIQELEPRRQQQLQMAYRRDPEDVLRACREWLQARGVMTPESLDAFMPAWRAYMDRWTSV